MDEIERLGERLSEFIADYRWCMSTKTRDTSEYGYHYVSALLRMDAKRNMTEIGRQSGVSKQNMHHFMSNSPWSSSVLIENIQNEIGYHPEFQEGAMLIFDESADEKKGTVSAGAGRQHNGRLGKVEMSQVGVFATLSTPQVNLWIDGELYLPEHWFDDSAKAQRKRVGIPKERTFKTKPELVWILVERIRETNVPFVAVAMDDLYGRNTQLRQRLDARDIEYYGDIPCNTTLYLDKPKVQYIKGKRGKRKRVVVAEQRVQASDLLNSAEMERAQLTLRPSERGMLQAEFARCRVWTLAGDTPRREWLLIRRNGTDITYVLSNAAPECSLKTMAWRKSHRYFVERSNQDAKSELGWDEFQATKYLAWQHQLALTILASWFIADTRLDWMNRFEKDPDLRIQYETDYLPLLSVANVRELLKAAMPLPQLSTAKAVDLVIEHFVNRTRSRTSRLKSSGASSINEQLSRM